MKKISILPTIVLIFIFSILNSFSQNYTVNYSNDVVDHTINSSAPALNCARQSSAFINRYNIPDPWIPSLGVNHPVRHLKINVFILDDAGNTHNYNPSNTNHINSLNYIFNTVNNIYRTNAAPSDLVIPANQEQPSSYIQFDLANPNFYFLSTNAPYNSDERSLIRPVAGHPESMNIYFVTGYRFMLKITPGTTGTGYPPNSNIPIPISAPGAYGTPADYFFSTNGSGNVIAVGAITEGFGYYTIPAFTIPAPSPGGTPLQLDASLYVESGNAQYPSMQMTDQSDIVLFNPNISNNQSDWATALVICHELGHILHVPHTYNQINCSSGAYGYYSDIFGSTPPGTCLHIDDWNANCQALNGDRITNNIDGGNKEQTYYSPQQVGQMHNSLALYNIRKYLSDCVFDQTSIWDINGNEGLDFDMQMDRSISVNNNSTLELKCKLSMPDISKIIVNSGSTLVVNGILTNNCNNGWNGTIEVKPGGTLRLSADAEITLKGNGKILIADDASNPGKLIFEPGAEVYLDDYTSSIEINGNLEIANNATFEFKHHSSPHGFVKFGNTLHTPSRNIIAGTNCKINLQGTSSNNKILEIVQETFYAPDNLVQLKLNNGKVVLNPNSRLQPDGLATSVDFNNVRFTSNTPGSNNGHRGVHLYGQQNISISTCTFEYGKYGIFSYQTYGGAPLNLLGCIFRHNEIGIRAYDKGLGLYQCNFFNNSWGVLANEMSFPSMFIDGLTGGGVVNSNSTGISWQGYATPGLWLDNPYINTNSTGISTHGSPLNVRCGSISYNNDGILLTHGAGLFMDDQWGGPSAVTVFNNYYSIRAAGGNEIFLNSGKNDLSPSSLNDYRSVFGSSYLPAGNLDAASNQWNVLGTFSTSDYSLTGFGGAITLTDGSPLSSIQTCGQAIPPCPTPPCPNQSPLENCPNCDIINTDDFPGVKLNIATKDALAMLNSNLPDKYKNAIGLFYQILNEIYNNPDDKEKYLLSLNYIKMMDALGNAYKFGQLTCGSLEPNPDPGAPVNIEPLPENVVQVISILDNMISKADNDGNYNLRFKYSMDKAQTLRLACKREDCINLLNEMLNWAVGEDVNEINKFICEVNLEIMVINGSVPLEDVSEMLATCNYGSGRVRDNSETVESLEKLLPPAVYLTVDIFQANRSGVIDVKTNAEFAHMIVMNSIGELVLETDINYDSNINSEKLSAGVYIINVTNIQTGESLGKKFVVD